MAIAPASVEHLLLLLLEKTREHAIVLLDPEGHIRWWNPGAAHIFAMPKEAAVGKPLTVLFTEEDRDSGMDIYEIAKASTHGTAEDDRWMARADGSLFWASGVLVALRDAHGELLGFGKILRNRTDLREQIEALRNQVEEVDYTSHQKDVFLSTLSHELRNPLAPLSNAAQLIRLTMPARPELEYPLKILERQIENLRRLVDDLLDVSRIGAGKIQLNRKIISVHDVIHRAVESTRPLVAERGHRLEVLLPSGQILIDADPVRMEQVIVNLISNAAKYTPEGGRIWVTGTSDGAEAVMHVQDNGIGIPHEMLPRIFELFTQVESSRWRSQGGLGIGLSLVKQLVTMHGGSVQVRSEGEGKGSEFSVRLPLKRSVIP